MKLGLMGFPIRHSLSPRIFEFLGRNSQISVQYDLIETDEEIQSLPEGYNGLNVTMPNKREVAKFCDGLDLSARQTGAVNLINFNDREKTGYNTDVYGVTESLRALIPEGKNLKALVIGAGGGARAAIVALADLGLSDISVVVRTDVSWSNLRKDLGLSIKRFEPKNSETFDVLVNASPQGLNGVDSTQALSCLEYLTSGAVVLDMVYSPVRTTLIESAQERGFKTVDGLRMLVWQALKGWEIWTGQKSDSSVAETLYLYLLGGVK